MSMLEWFRARPMAPTSSALWEDGERPSVPYRRNRLYYYPVRVGIKQDGSLELGKASQTPSGFGPRVHCLRYTWACGCKALGTVRGSSASQPPGERCFHQGQPQPVVNDTGTWLTVLP